MVQAVGGVGEAVLGGGIAGAGGVATATGAGAAPGIPAVIGGSALFANGLDNAQAGLRTAFTGNFQHTIAAETAGSIAQVAGATPVQAERACVGTELASGALSLGGGLAAGVRAGGRTALGKGIGEALDRESGLTARTAEEATEAVGDVRPIATFQRTTAELDALASDPAHGGTITARSIQERVIGLDLEKRGLVPGPITRDPSGAAEFIDALGQRWDVKGFVSEIQTRTGATRNVFNLTDSIANIERSINASEHFMLDLSRMNKQDAQSLLAEVQRRGWNDKVIH